MGPTQHMSITSCAALAGQRLKIDDLRLKVKQSLREKRQKASKGLQSLLPAAPVASSDPKLEPPTCPHGKLPDR